jgi:CRP-like cAMP-binding protein
VSQQPELNTTNRILLSLTHEESERLRPALTHVELPHAMIIYEAEGPIDTIYFPNKAILSAVNTTDAGESVETGVIGRDGISGVESLLGEAVALNRNIVQIVGDGFRAPLDVVKAEFSRAGGFQRTVLAYARALMAQMSQTALCNRLHPADERLAKWLLTCRDRTDTDTLDLTQEFAALMLGSNRVTLNQAASKLQDLGLIEYTRGRISLIDLPALEKFSCTCYRRIRDAYVAAGVLTA